MARRTASRGEERALLLPLDPDVSAERLRTELQRRHHVEAWRARAVVISDSFGRAWRMGVKSVPLGAAGVPTVIDLRGHLALFGRKLETPDVAFADAWLLDRRDRELADAFNMPVEVCNTLMRTIEDRERPATQVLSFADRLEPRKHARDP